jgi:hypothetical protein
MSQGAALRPQFATCLTERICGDRRLVEHRSGREAVSAFNDSPFQPGSAFPCRNNVCGSRNPLKKASDNLIKLPRYYNNRAGQVSLKLVFSMIQCLNLGPERLLN